MEEIVGIVFKYDTDDYCYWNGFTLTEEEKRIISKIILKHENDGCSVRGTISQIISEIK